MVKGLEHKSWYGAGDVEQDGLFLPPKGMSVKPTDVRAISWEDKMEPQ